MIPNITVMIPSTVALVSSAVRIGGEYNKGHTEKYPRPLIISVILDRGQSCCQKATKRSRQRSGAVEKSDSIQHLVSSIEHSQINDDAAEQTALEQAQEQSSDYKASKRLGEAQECAHQSPRGDQGRQVETCFHMLDDPVARDIDEDIKDIENDQSDIELRPRRDTQIRGQSINLGISNVTSVNERKQPG